MHVFKKLSQYVEGKHLVHVVHTRLTRINTSYIYLATRQLNITLMNRLRFTKWSQWKKRYFGLETLYEPSRLSVERCKAVEGVSTFRHCNTAKISTTHSVRDYTSGGTIAFAGAFVIYL